MILCPSHGPLSKKSGDFRNFTPYSFYEFKCTHFKKYMFHLTSYFHSEVKSQRGMSVDHNLQIWRTLNVKEDRFWSSKIKIAFKVLDCNTITGKLKIRLKLSNISKKLTLDPPPVALNLPILDKLVVPIVAKSLWH